MIDEFEPGDALLFMKVGTHAQEELSAIIARKQSEIAAAGYTMWGYGGNTCHPTTMVQRFARAHALPSKPILLVMQPMISNHFAEPVRAEEFSVDGRTWQSVPLSAAAAKRSRSSFARADIKRHPQVRVTHSHGTEGGGTPLC